MKELNRFRQFLNESYQPDLYRYEIDYYGKEGTPFFLQRARIKTVLKAEDPREERNEKAKAIALQHFIDNYDINSFYPKPVIRAYGFPILDRPEVAASVGKTTSKMEGNLDLNFVKDVIKNLGYGNSENKSGNKKSDIDPNQTIFSTSFRDPMESLEVILYVAADNKKEAKMLAQQYMDKEYEDSFKFARLSNLGVFDDLDPFGEKDADLWKGKIADFGMDNYN